MVKNPLLRTLASAMLGTCGEADLASIEGMKVRVRVVGGQVVTAIMQVPHRRRQDGRGAKLVTRPDPTLARPK